MIDSLFLLQLHSKTLSDYFQSLPFKICALLFVFLILQKIQKIHRCVIFLDQFHLFGSFRHFSCFSCVFFRDMLYLLKNQNKEMIITRTKLFAIWEFLLLKKSTLKVRLALIFSILCIFSMSILLRITIRTYSAQIIGHIYENERNLLKTGSALLDANLEKYAKMSRQIFANSKIRALLDSSGQDTVSGQKNRELRQVKEVFTETIYNLDTFDITSIVICSKDGKVFSSYDLAGEIDSYDNFFYQTIKNSDSSFVIFPTDGYRYLKTKTRDSFAIGRLIRNDFLEETGYLLIFISLDFFEQSLSKSNLKDSSSYYVITDQTQIMYRENHLELDSDMESVLLDEVQNNHTDSFILPIGAQQYLITKYDSDYSGWTMVSVSDLSEITRAVHTSLRRSLIIFGLMVIAIFRAAWLIAKSFTKPLSEIQQVMSEISSGNLALRVSQYPSPDINNLATQFNKMLNRIDMLMEENRQKQTELIETELQMLRAQINPHFIYNTLNSISWLAVFNGQTQIKTQLSNLTTLLRSAYSNPDQLITIADEKEILTCYTSIMKLRYDNFSLLFDHEEYVEQYMIPKCILQPIVENSIIHGFPDLDRPCRIQILFHRDLPSGLMKITIEDNGVGMSQEQQEQCLKDSGSDTHFNNIGIHNVDQRIKLKFGTSYGLHISSREGDGTKVLVCIPLMTQGGELTYD